MDQKWLKEQKEEFIELDENHDGLLTKDELSVRKTSFEYHGIKFRWGKRREIIGR